MNTGPANDLLIDSDVHPELVPIQKSSDIALIWSISLFLIFLAVASACLYVNPMILKKLALLTHHYHYFIKRYFP
ncbi:hypothetical protein ACS5NO_32385 [Larkinella sp. GY13]|uniref:hypothetical protein n=1 Tax=Larkinella sp. GY13 TaxID=3453720 RepID=UPI003EE94F3C